MAINQDILTYARAQLNTKVGDGECWTYVENAVTGAGGVSSRTLTPNFGPNANYVWGDTRALSALQAGNLVQFRNYSWTRTVEETVTFADGGGSTSTQTTSESRPHHSAIVNNVTPGGLVEILEQNAPAGSSVHATSLCLSARPIPQRTTQEQRPNPNNNNRMERATVVTSISDSVTGTVTGFQAKTP